ncbi:unnamed protein product [Clavelina lepadiformis]|uniref:Uncharacterized protein n=2 Tax=Clavelina lepadiformis TaxID=159417 RepID=A0ABP0GSR9_CLALP
MEQSNVTTMDNETHLRTPPFAPYHKTYWIVSEITLALLTAFALYLFACLAWYATITKCKPGREISCKKGKTLYRLCLVSVVMAIFRFVADQGVAIAGWHTDTGCVISVSVSTVFYSLSLYPVYIFLWMRQSIFYANPVLSHVLNPAVTVLSYVTLIVMLFGGAVLTVIYIIPDVTGWKYNASAEGCRDTAHKSGFDLVPTMVVCFTVCFQLGLLALFMYPLLTKKTQRYRTSSTAKRNTDSSQSEKHEESMSESPDAIDNNLPSETCSNGLTKGGNHSSACWESNYRLSLDSKDVLDTESKNHTCVDIRNDVNGKPPRFGSFQNSFIKKANVLYRKAPEREQGRKKKSKNRMSSSSFSDLMKRQRSASSVSSDNESGTKRKLKKNKTMQGQRVIRFIRKAFVLALICVISDVIFTIIQLMIKVPELVYLAIFDVNLMVNILCIIMSFRDWPRMIIPLCAGCRQSKQKTKNHSSVNGLRNTHVTHLKVNYNANGHKERIPQSTSQDSSHNNSSD